MDLVSRADWLVHPVLAGLGPEPLSDDFDAAALARACRGKRTSLKVALLDQRVVAGLGNIYVSEALHRARLSPRRLASTIATPSGAPRDSARRLTSAIKAVLREAVERREAYAPRARRRPRFHVYDRENERCLHKDCPGTIRRITQAGQVDVLLSGLSEVNVQRGQRFVGSRRLSNRRVRAMEHADAVRLLSSPELQPIRPQTWADLGCGDGVFTRALASLLVPGSTIHAMDRDPAALRALPAEHARRRDSDLDSETSPRGHCPSAPLTGCCWPTCCTTCGTR